MRDYAKNEKLRGAVYVLPLHAGDPSITAIILPGRSISTNAMAKRPLCWRDSFPSSAHSRPSSAGVGNMHYHAFVTHNIIGRTLWVAGVTLFGYELEVVMSDSYMYSLPIVIGIIAPFLAEHI